MQTQTLHRKIVAGSLKFAPASGVGAREIEVIASDGTVDRMGDILEPAGARLENFRRTPTVLANHDAHQPIARASQIGLVGNKIVARIEFPPPGTSVRSDEFLRLAKAGVIGAASVGFLPLTWEPIKGAGLRFTAWELLELSLVSVPANPSARVTQKRVSTSSTPRLDVAEFMLDIVRSSPIGERIARVAKIRAENRAALARAREKWRDEIDELLGR